MTIIHTNLHLGKDPWTLIVISSKFISNNPKFTDWLGELDLEAGTTVFQMYSDLSASLWFRNPEDVTMFLLRWRDQLELYPAA